MSALSRREFLRVAGISALGLAIACGKGPDRRGGLIAGARTLDEVIDGRSPGAQMPIGEFETLPGVPQRIVFGLIAGTGDFFQGGSANLWAAKDRTSPVLGPFPATFHGEGLGTRGVYVAQATFPENGTYLLLAEALPHGRAEPLIAGAPRPLVVGRNTKMPLPGDRAVSVPTPTVRNARGVDPICTRTPPCSMHQVSLDDALRAGRPTVLIIATPKYCQTALCGPEVDIIQTMSREFAGRASFIHAEVLKDDENETVERFFPLSPASEAWMLEQEPAMYFIDAQGVIAQRFIGPLDETEARGATQALVAG